MRQPKISIIIPVYNARPFLRETLRSVLDQRECELDVVVADDGSTDGSLDEVTDLLEKPVVRVHRQANAGKSTTLNRVLATCDADYYAVQDADDLAYPLRASLQSKALDAAPKVAAVFCGFDLIIGGRRLAPMSCLKDERACARNIELFRMPSHDPTAMYRLASVRDFAYSEDLAIGQGLDYILRVGERHPMRCIPEVLYGYRIHAGSNTKSSPSRRNRFVQQLMIRACRRRGLDPAMLGFMDPDPGAKSATDHDNHLYRLFCDSAASLRAAGRPFAAMTVAWQSIRFNPRSLDHYRPLGNALLPPGVTKRRRMQRDEARIACIQRARLAGR